MFINRTLKGCYSSKLWSSAIPLKTKTFNNSIPNSMTCTSSISSHNNNPMPIYDITRKSPPSFLQLVNLRNFSVTPQKKDVPLDDLNKLKKLREEEPRWYHPSPTERMENPAYTYLKNHPEYQRLFFQHEIYSKLMTEDGRLTSEGEQQVNPAVKAFIDLCNSQPDELITDSKYEPIFADLISQTSQLTDVELLLVYFNFRRFSKRPKGKDKDYKKIWQPLDDLCLLRIQQQAWNLEFMFNLADLIYSVGLSTESKFHWELVKKLYRRVDNLSKEEFIRMMFCFGGVKSLPDTLSIYNIEYNLPKFIDELTSEEVAVISVGLLRTKTCVQNKDVLRKMLQIVTQDAQRIPSPSVSAVCKAIIISKTITIEEDIYEFLEAFVPEISRLDIHACASLMLMGLNTRVKHEILCTEMLNKLGGKVDMIRSKDLEYICNTLASFNIECDEFFGEIVEDLRKRTVSMSTKVFSSVHGRSFINILVNLCMRNIYPQDLISLALSDDFLGYTFGRSMYTYTQEVLYLDICSGIEAVNYSGPRLSDKYRGFLTKKNMLWIADEEKVSSSEYQKIARFMLAVCDNSLGGPEFCHICNIVPPFRTIGVVYCLRESDSKPVPVPENFTTIDDFIIKYIPEPEKDETDDNKIQFHAFVLFPGSQATVTTSEPMGMAVMHCRQMQKLGFHIHPIYLGHTVTNPTEMKKFVSEVLGTPIPEEPKIE
ncbi:FAST kinase domain-containing protein 5 [Orchesella cincta]|uniref:FAST kinase domain-containing protein 5 n=1 Tax=Orchesella cincta TaxID=48709 RepID=A0A1D2N5K6_ORCCI|nr:FAST kinase domain-containing protein 5 [Orchesella cincta]